MLAQVQVLLYATVLVSPGSGSNSKCDALGTDGLREKGKGASAVVAQFVLTDTHLGLLREDAIFYPPPRSLCLAPSRPQFSLDQLRRREDVRCVVVKHATRLDVVLTLRASTTGAKGHRGHGGQPQCGCRTSGTNTLWAEKHSHPSLRPEVWKLTFGGAAEASCLINYLSDS